MTQFSLKAQGWVTDFTVYILWQVDIHGFKRSTAVMEWMGKHSLCIFVLVSSNLAIIAIQGFYWKSPSNNLVSLLDYTLHLVLLCSFVQIVMEGSRFALINRFTGSCLSLYRREVVPLFLGMVKLLIFNSAQTSLGCGISQTDFSADRFKWSDYTVNCWFCCYDCFGCVQSFDAPRQLLNLELTEMYSAAGFFCSIISRGTHSLPILWRSRQAYRLNLISWPSHDTEDWAVIELVCTMASY